MNVRWDAVVNRTQMYARDISRGPHVGAEGADAGAMVPVHVWLFGSLAPAGVERPVRLSMPAPATVGQVLVELRHRFGQTFTDPLIDESGSIHSHYRLFVDGFPAEELDSPLAAADKPSQVELILLSAAEGG